MCTLSQIILHKNDQSQSLIVVFQLVDVTLIYDGKTMFFSKYIRTCYEEPLLRHRKSGLSRQVAAHRRFICI